jgi:hypothetical protein
MNTTSCQGSESKRKQKMSLFDRFRSTESLVTELAQHEVDIYCIEGHMPENANTEEYEESSKVYIQDAMTRDQVISKLDETRKIVRQ